MFTIKHRTGTGEDELLFYIEDLTSHSLPFIEPELLLVEAEADVECR